MLKIHNLSFAIDGKPLFDNAYRSDGHKVVLLAKTALERPVYFG